MKIKKAKIETAYPFPKGFGFARLEDGGRVFLHDFKGTGLVVGTRRNRRDLKVPQGSDIGCVCENGPKGLFATLWGPLSVVEAEVAQKVATLERTDRLAKEAKEKAEEEKLFQAEYVRRWLSSIPAKFKRWEEELPGKVEVYLSSTREGKPRQDLRPGWLIENSDRRKYLPEEYALKVSQLLLPYQSQIEDAEEEGKLLNQKRFNEKWDKGVKQRADNFLRLREVIVTLGLGQAATPHHSRLENPECLWVVSTREMGEEEMKEALLEERSHAVSEAVVTYARQLGMETHSTYTYFDSSSTESAGWGDYHSHTTMNKWCSELVAQAAKLDQELGFKVCLPEVAKRVVD